MSDEPVVVISGQISAGKTTAGKMLRERGFQYARISQAIRTRWDGGPVQKPPRSWYQQMGMKLHREIGQSALCQETIALIKDPLASFVIDGARWNEDVKFFKDNFGPRAIHVHLVASTEVRQRRFDARDKDVSFSEADADEVESEVNTLSTNADAIFDNSADDHGRLESFLNSILRRA